MYEHTHTSLLSCGPKNTAIVVGLSSFCILLSCCSHSQLACTFHTLHAACLVCPAEDGRQEVHHNPFFLSHSLLSYSHTQDSLFSLFHRVSGSSCVKERRDRRLGIFGRHGKKLVLALLLSVPSILSLSFSLFGASLSLPFHMTDIFIQGERRCKSQSSLFLPRKLHCIV